MKNPNDGAGTDRDCKNDQIHFVDYRDESQLEHVDRLVAVDLSEPYSIFTYRYFLNRYPDLCILAVDKKSGEVCGCVVGKIDVENMNNGPSDADMSTSDSDADGKTSATHTAQTGDILDSNNAAPRAMTETVIQTGYIGMLAVSKSYRRRGIGKDLVRQVLQRMKERGCTSVTLETEVSNVTAQKLYQNHFGFIREELLVRYYLNCGDAYRLRLWF
jgi:peptide alpha-N-acetyltransferase